MKAIGYVRCAVCEVLLRGYPPRNWTPGEQLCVWQHRLGGMEDGYQGGRSKCEGSYKPGTDTHLDEQFARTETPSDKPTETMTGLTLIPIYAGRGICGTSVAAYEVPEIDAGESCRVVVGDAPNKGVALMTRAEALTLGRRLIAWAELRTR